jgi:hypothetical protein
MVGQNLGNDCSIPKTIVIYRPSENKDDGLTKIIYLMTITQGVVVELAFLTPPLLGGISAEVREISPHNSDFL